MTNIIPNGLRRKLIMDRAWPLSYAIGVLILTSVFAIMESLQAQGVDRPPSAVRSDLTAETIFERYADRVIYITCETVDDAEVQASGVLVSQTGYFITNAHVVRSCTSIVATLLKGKARASFEASVWYYSQDSDTAVLKFDGNRLPYFELSRQDVSIGQRIYAIGSPRGLEQTISEGIVSGNRVDGGLPWIQHSAPISPGSSGGALIGSKGNLVGINSFHIKDSQNLNFAVPSSTLTEALALAKLRNKPLSLPLEPRKSGVGNQANEQPTPAIESKIVEKPSETQPKATAAPVKVLARAREAMGGTAKLQAIKDLTQTTTMQLDVAAGGLKITQTGQWLAPAHFRQENILPFGKVISYSDGTTGWSATPQGLIPAPEAQLKQITLETFRMWWSLMLSDTSADRTVNDLGGGKLEISDKAGHMVTLVIDPKTGLPASQTYAPPGNSNGAVEEVYADWQDVSGIRLPRKITLNQAGKHFADVTVVSTALNSGLTAEQISKKP